MATRRRDFLRSLGALGLLALPRATWPQEPPKNLQIDPFCGTGDAGSPLFIPGASGPLGRLAPRGVPFTMRAAPTDPSPRPWSLAYQVELGGQRFVDPTLVLSPGERVRITLDNAIGEPTIVHWHGFTIDTRNDGGGTILAQPGEHYAYDFEVRNRGGLYWYHPHPHGLTAGQAYRGLFGLIEIEDADERALRTALDLTPGKTEIPLMLQDRRAGGDYTPSDADRMHGFVGDSVLINGTACPHLDVATRLYRFRVLNASDARTYRLGFRTAAGRSVPFTLIGNDGGLLPKPQPCAEAFLASAERLDLLLDLSTAAVGDTLYLDTRTFDPMHMEMPAATAKEAAPVDHAAMGHAMPQGAAHVDHAAMGHGGAFPEGAARALLELRVRRRESYAARVPARLSNLEPIDVAGASERPLRLGFAKGRWRINDRVFVMGETPIEVKRGTVETWLIRNYFNSMPHAMHLHGFHFDVLERQTSPDQIAALKIDDHGRLATDLGRKDTVLVWPGETVRVAIDFSLPAAASFAGDQVYMFHCHNLEHEDGGMMLGVRVV
ncbi:MAG TPA: multicopper oxidase family protein [Casimicrobiaceae bacterium]|nr:multicopper oxidase family protein [Casimicrobiaceae bacterium]